MVANKVCFNLKLSGIILCTRLRHPKAEDKKIDCSKAKKLTVVE